MLLKVQVILLDRWIFAHIYGLKQIVMYFKFSHLFLTSNCLLLNVYVFRNLFGYIAECNVSYLPFLKGQQWKTTYFLNKTIVFYSIMQYVDEIQSYSNMFYVFCLYSYCTYFILHCCNTLCALYQHNRRICSLLSIIMNIIMKLIYSHYYRKNNGSNVIFFFNSCLSKIKTLELFQT